tara:strand:- start:390 stop:923 length:534 start_codon:yes stop_codon:yes gene_type:complete
MIIEIDLELLEELDLRPNEYIALHCKHKEIDICDKFNDYIHWGDLMTAGWLDGNWQITDKWLDLFAADFDNLFKELLEVYPAVVESPNRGRRVLHAKDPNAYTNMKAKNRYRKITNEKVTKHKEIIRLLQIQLETDKDSLGYMQKLETWLNNYTWEDYIDINLDKSNKNDGRITRSL